MSVRSQRNMRDKLGIDSRGEPTFMRSGQRSRVPMTRQLLEARRFGNYRDISSTAAWEHTFARASAATWRDPRNEPVSVPNNRDRYRVEGIERTLVQVEGARTNFLSNSNAPATQTSGSLGVNTYTLWVEGTGTATVTAGTATITGGGAATAGSPRVFNVTVAGTVTVTVTGTLTRFQMEAGGFATSFIPTLSTAITRQADRMVWTPTARGSGLLLSPGASGAGTIIGQFILPQVNTSVDQVILSVDNGGDANRMTVLQPTGGTTLAFRAAVASVQNVNLAAGVTITANTRYRFAFAWSGATQWAFVVTGGAVVTAGSGAGPSGLTAVRYGHLQAGASEANGFVGIVDRINARLSNTQLLDAVRLL